ncbi:hypothetical protein ADUPG1_007340, partial [Aduncisulcus paluster]
MHEYYKYVEVSVLGRNSYLREVSQVARAVSREYQDKIIDEIMNKFTLKGVSPEVLALARSEGGLGLRLADYDHEDALMRGLIRLLNDSPRWFSDNAAAFIDSLEADANDRYLEYKKIISEIDGWKELTLSQ